MPAQQATTLLRAGLLDGVRIAVAGPADPSPDSAGEAVRIVVESLGGTATRFAVGVSQAPEQAEADARRSFAAVLAELGDCGAVVIDGASLSSAGDGREALLDCLEACWNAARTAVSECFLRDGKGGRILLIGPRPDEAEHAQAAVAGLENLARTLSIEWARFGITAVAIAPGAKTATDDVASIVAYLASPAGAYFSGCLMDLRGPG